MLCFYYIPEGKAELSASVLQSRDQNSDTMLICWFISQEKNKITLWSNL